MLQNFQRVYERYFRFRHIDIIAGIIAIGFIIAVRSFGGFQFLELFAFDAFMRSRPQEPPDKRVLIVGVNEDDIRDIDTYPVPDQKIASLLKELRTHQPVAIGLDIYRDLPIPPGTSELKNTFQSTKNLIAIEKILPDISGKSGTVDPPPHLPPEQIGFADAVIDQDGKQRRALLGASNLNNEWRLSLSLKLAQIYLAKKGFLLDNVDGDDRGMRFGSTKLERFSANRGGYVNADDGGTQVLINFRNHPQPFDIISLSDILNKNISADRIRNKIVLIGITSPSVKDYVISEAIKPKIDNQYLIYGVEVKAHIVSQIISAVEDKRTFIRVWSNYTKHLFIIIIGILGILIGRSINSSLKLVLIISVVSLILISIAYQALIYGWWIPIIPPIIIFLCNGLVIPTFYKYDEALRTRIKDRQLVINQTFETIHGGPLQKLSMILRTLDSNEDLEKEKLSLQLKQLNRELREVHQSLQQEVYQNDKILYLNAEQQLNLEQQIHEILHQVYIEFLERNNPKFENVPEFKNLKLKIVDFQKLDEHNLSLGQKRGLCRFLEEGLNNAGKYAQGMTRLHIICKQEEGNNIIRVIDNGCGIDRVEVSRISHRGLGTQQAENLARQLNGKFQRFPNSPKGTVYELSWSAKRLRFWLF